MSSFLNSWNLNVSSQIIEGNKLKATTVAIHRALVSVSVTTKLATIVVTGRWLVTILVTVIMDLQTSDMVHVMALMHVNGMARTPRQRSEMDLVVTPMPADLIEVPSVIMLVRNTLPA